MKFKAFLLEGIKESIIVELNNMSEAELSEFGDWLYSEFYDVDVENEVESSTEDSSITKEEIIEMLGEMDSDDLEYISDMVSCEEDDEDAHTEYNPNLQESVSRRLTNKNRNKQKRKFMGNSQADMRRTKVTRKKEARKNRSKRRRDYRKNKVKKLAYNASRNAAIKKGTHKVKLRKKA